MQILVFKTSLVNNSHIKKIGPSLSLHPKIREWNVDLHDRDNILRVVSKNIIPSAIEMILINAGYYCEELE